MKTLGLKSILLVAAIGTLSYNAMAQKKVKNVPPVVSSAFANQYPQANLKGWEMDRSQYIAEFKYDNRDWMAHYSADGNWLRSERNIKHIANLPADIRMAVLNSKYASYHVDEIARLQMPGQNNMYRLRVDNNNGNKVAFENAASVDNESLYFTEHGRLVKAVSGDE